MKIVLSYQYFDDAVRAIMMPLMTNNPFVGIELFPSVGTIEGSGGTFSCKVK